MLLITRPIKDSLKTAERLAGLGFQTVIHPLLTIQNLSNINPDFSRYTHLLITSYNAITAIDTKHLNNLNAFVVGARSAKALKGLGIGKIIMAKDIQHLKKVICLKKPTSIKILYLSGDKITSGLFSYLKNHGFFIERLIVYKSIINNTKAISLKSITNVMLYSTRTAQAFKMLYSNEDLNNLNLICISNKVANVVKSLKVKQILVANLPEEDSMIKLLYAR